MQGGESLSQNPNEVCLSELQVNCRFKGAHTYFILSAHVFTFLIGAIKAKTYFS